MISAVSTDRARNARVQDVVGLRLGLQTAGQSGCLRPAVFGEAGAAERPGNDTRHGRLRLRVAYQQQPHRAILTAGRARRLTMQGRLALRYRPPLFRVSLDTVSG